MPDKPPPYRMTISLNVLNHMGLNLYSNTPAVLAEVISNSWDADATEVDVDFDLQGKSITVTDNGCGMTCEDVNSKYLYVGYQKRLRQNELEDELVTPELKRKPMGRKGIGKLSLFSIANRIHVYTRVEEGAPEAFLMDAEKIKAAIDNEDPSKVQSYEPEPISASNEAPQPHGARIRITGLKKVRLTEASVEGLRRHLARRFSIIGDTNQFSIKVNGKKITLADRDYFHKARFIFQYGDNDNYAKHCRELEKDDNGNITGLISRSCEFDSEGKASNSSHHNIKGWIAIVWHSNDLDSDRPDGNENLNKITLVVRGKVAQEDILQEFRLGGMITKYMFGEIEADFLDLDDQSDIATSGRQSISEDDSRYKALISFIESELKEIWKQTNILKERAGIRHALSSNPHLKQWYEGLCPPHLKNLANKIFGDIEKANIEKSMRQNAYANGVILFEHLKMAHATKFLDKIDVTKVGEFINYLRGVDALEAEHYRQIVEERLAVIRKLRDDLDEDAKERVLQEYIFDHLFLLDPGWERATEFEDMECRMERVLEGKAGKSRLDIQYTKYRRVAAAHVIIELKRRSVKVTKTDLESQVRGYQDALRAELQNSSSKNANLPIQGICIVASPPKGWADEKMRR